MVSIVVVSLNNEAFIAECLSCALAQDYDPKEVIVVDQGSRDRTVSIIREQYPQMALIENRTNTGFAAGMNRGIDASRGEFILLLNSDLFLEPTFVSRAAAHLASRAAEERVGMLASIVHGYRRGQRTSEIDSLGMMLAPYHAVVDSECLDRVDWVAGPPGAAMFLSRTMLEDVRLPGGGYLDDSYFCYGEDTELVLRAQMLGWRCLFVPIVAGWHMGSASASGEARFWSKPPALLVHAIKNRYLTVLSCYPAGLLLWTLPWHLLTEAGQLLAPALKRHWTHVACIFRAYLAVVSLLPDAWAKRRWLQARRCVSCSYLRSLYIRWGPLRTFEFLCHKA